jgi:hypothetical protein
MVVGWFGLAWLAAVSTMIRAFRTFEQSRNRWRKTACDSRAQVR